MKTTLAIRMLLASSSLFSAMPASAAELDGALAAAVFDGSPAVYAPAPADLSPSACACRTAYLQALPEPLDRDAD